MHKEVIIRGNPTLLGDFGGIQGALDAMGFGSFGLSEMFDDCMHDVKQKLPNKLVSGSYPPSNVMVDSNKSLIIEIAAAGFAKDNFEIDVENDYMTVTFKCPETRRKTFEDIEDLPEDERPEHVTYLQQAIKIRDSELKFYIDPKKFNKEDVVAKFENGMLEIVVAKNPDLDVKKSIKIK